MRAEGRCVYAIPIMVWADDVSGNVSKQWNKHLCVTFSNLALPRQQLEQECNIHFVGTSTHTSSLELMEGLVRMIEEMNSVGREAFDVVSKAPVLLLTWIAILAGDNPMQGEMCCSKGMQANKFCRRCHAGGNLKYRRSEAGYASLFETGILRQRDETAAHVREMLSLAAAPGRRAALQRYSTTYGIRDTYAEPVLEQLQEHTKNIEADADLDEADAQELLAEARMTLGAAFAINPLLRLTHLDPHLSTPVEILHTFLLGLVKYLWGATVEYLEAPAKKVPGRPLQPLAARSLALLQTRLASLNEYGWKQPKLQPMYLVQHKKQLIGKHLKQLAQCMPFVIEDLVSEPLLEAWVLVGLATPLLWTTSIRDSTAYVVRVSSSFLAPYHRNPPPPLPRP
ncbi:hypothetical protein CALCODRAFT_535658 [Calocera cornea HHB12733]|uniref:Uncharacterized protein n=1 Tax=Calocera cornea HHB12733 TaxID=1353952 RepID=A0A165CG07_9BASI|nr:hypothetical protein CALCODRAFT_535658 [Calocera cornea HHB12733]